MKRQAFTLVELIVVILILGILAGVAAPKFLDTSSDATEASVRQTLAVVRDAIELYTAQHNGRVPAHNGNASGAGSLAENLKDYLRNGIPKCPVGKQDNSVQAVSGADTEGVAPAQFGWIYNTVSGTFICGLDDDIPSDSSIHYDEL